MLDLLELVSVSTVLSSSVLDRLISAWSFLRSRSKNRLLCRLYRRIWLTLAWSLASSILNGHSSIRSAGSMEMSGLQMNNKMFVAKQVLDRKVEIMKSDKVP